jgi:ABC-type transport system involved in cytochrome c biogenesis permease subunit
MEHIWLSAIGVVFSLSFLAESAYRVRLTPRLDRWALHLERLGFIIFTSGVATFAFLSYSGSPLLLKKSVAWLFFAWALATAQTITRWLYGNRTTSLFVKAWLVLAMLVTPAFREQEFVDYFSSNLTWLNFHRAVFLFGYAFYILGLPLAISFLWKTLVEPVLGKSKDGILEHRLEELDRVHLKLILWALPLLSLGILTKILLLLDAEALVTPAIIARTATEEFLAIVTWFTSALYLHARIFLGWHYRRCAYVYIAGLIVVLAAHFSGRMLLQVS